MTILEVKDLHFSYGGLRVLQGISFSLKQSEKVALIGPNGTGKSTLLNLLSGLLSPNAGKVYLSGNDISKLSPHQRVSSGIGRSFQKSSLFFGLNVLDNTLVALEGIEPSRFQMSRHIRSNRHRVAQAQQLLEAVDLWEKREDTVATLCHGEQRRLEIALSIACRPKVLLLDEPSAGLTGGESAALVKMLRNLMQNTAVLLAAHDLDLVFEVADRVLVLYYGNILAEGTPEEIQNDPKVREIYLGTGA